MWWRHAEYWWFQNTFAAVMDGNVFSMVQFSNSFMCVSWRIATYFIVFFLCACSADRVPDAEAVAGKSGTNRRSLERALKHFSEEEPAAMVRYLISNMQDHYTGHKLELLPDSILLDFNYLDTTFKGIAIAEARMNEGAIKSAKLDAHVVSRIRDFEPAQQKEAKVKDIYAVKGDMIIAHVGHAMRLKRESRFCRSISDDIFKETILPYRRLEAPIDLPAARLYDLYYDFLQADSSLSVREVVNKMNNYALCFKYLLSNDRGYTSYGFYNWLSTPDWSCHIDVSNMSAILNSCGVPTYVDYTPQHVNRIANRGHYWCASIDASGVPKPYTVLWHEIDNAITRRDFRFISKAYRQTYGINPDAPVFHKQEGEKLPASFDTPYIRDVTAEYLPVADIAFTDDGASSNSFHYLSVFCAPHWKPIAYSEPKSWLSDIKFKDVPTGRTYALSRYSKGGMLRNIGDLRYVEKNGNVINISANYNDRIELTLNQKYHQKEEVILPIVEAMDGLTFYGSTDLAFTNKVALHRVKGAPKPVLHHIDLSNSQPIRYVQVDTATYFSELYFLTDDSGLERPALKPFISSQQEVFQDVNYNALRFIEPVLYGKNGFPVRGKWASTMKMRDGDMESYQHDNRNIYDLGTLTKLSALWFAPRNANNWVVPGDVYELFFYDKGWISAGKKMAEYHFVSYEGIPSETIYWLQNLSRGKEEQAFFYHNGIQYFVNHDDVSALPFLKADK